VWFLSFCFLIAWGASSLACTDTLPFFLIRVRVAGVGLLSYHFSFLSCSFSRSEYHLFCAHEFCLRFLGPLFSPLWTGPQQVVLFSGYLLKETKRGWIFMEFLSLFVWTVQVGEDEGLFPGC
jgi:hypothetical protein